MTDIATNHPGNCPECSSDKRLVVLDDRSNPIIRRVECCECRAKTRNYQTWDEAVNEWNNL